MQALQLPLLPAPETRGRGPFAVTEAPASPIPALHGIPAPALLPIFSSPDAGRALLTWRC